MDLFRLDNVNYQPDLLIEDYSSLIWTERYQTPGEFSFVTADIEKTMDLLPEGSLISHLDTVETMMVETHEIAEDVAGNTTLTVSGRSVVAFLENRATNYDFVNPSGRQPNGSTFWIESRLSEAVYQGKPTAQDKIPNTNSQLFGTLPMYWSQVELTDTWSLTEKIIKDLGIGVSAWRTSVTYPFDIVFVLYKGKDRTTGQSANTPVSFRVDAGHFDNQRYFLSTKGWKNVAYVFSPLGYAIAARSGESIYVSGWDRRVLIVDANDITELQSGQNLNTLLVARGRQELAKYPRQRIFEGKVSSSVPYKYKTDYALGDLVTVSAEYGITQTMRVSEYIRSHDTQGDVGYPTLTLV